MQAPEINIFKDNPQVAEAFALFLFTWLKHREQATLALSGGSTPRLLFRHLASHYAHRIEWSKIQFFWGDERCVPPDDADSNFGMTHDLLLQHIDIPEANVHRIHGEAEPEREAQRYGEVIRKRVPAGEELPVFDFILLGMGSDGHTASIFPHQMELLKKKELCAVARHPDSGQARITLTGPVLNRARNIAFLVTGASKASKTGEIIGRRGNWQSYPAAHIHPARGNLYWFLDEAAGGSLIG